LNADRADEADFRDLFVFIRSIRVQKIGKSLSVPELSDGL
jgi:hypothetical protein